MTAIERSNSSSPRHRPSSGYRFGSTGEVARRGIARPTQDVDSNEGLRPPSEVSMPGGHVPQHAALETRTGGTTRVGGVEHGWNTGERLQRSCGAWVFENSTSFEVKDVDVALASGLAQMAKNSHRNRLYGLHSPWDPYVQVKRLQKDLSQLKVDNLQNVWGD